MASKTQKLADYVKAARESKEEFDIEVHVEESAINTDTEILAIKKELNQYNTKIKEAITATPFSASKLYEVRMKKELLERKYKAIIEIKKELF